MAELTREEVLALDDQERQALVKHALAAGRRSLDDLRSGRVIFAAEALAAGQALIDAHQSEDGHTQK